MGWQDDTYAEAIAGRIPAGAKLRKNASAQIVEAAPTSQKREYHDYKSDFLRDLRFAGLPMPSHGAECEQKELQFARPRLWRFDWAYEAERIAIEYQGGNYTGKGHNTIKNLRNDYEKFTEAALRGWMLILIDCETVMSGQAITWVERALRARMGVVHADQA